MAGESNPSIDKQLSDLIQEGLSSASPFPDGATQIFTSSVSLNSLTFLRHKSGFLIYTEFLVFDGISDR